METYQDLTLIEKADFKNSYSEQVKHIAFKKKVLGQLNLIMKSKMKAPSAGPARPDLQAQHSLLCFQFCNVLILPTCKDTLPVYFFQLLL